ncbi:hypothetical protein A4A49_61584 [Nicotiana attenuata]|uniref:RNase H type-1 domain-containing protein n=1 Tax=Nicotiana attenuata TaxID=49451 RepID=A0A1J6IM76_NICAT|nr:hypothetical protein A4A49_61584 [Nicotiana attenuata]
MGQKYSQMDWNWTWNNVCKVAEDYKIQLKSIMVLWEPPNSNQWKINTDGSFCANADKAGIGGVVRKRNGQMVMAFSAPVHFLTNNYSEVLVLLSTLFAILWCCDHNCQDLILELDSLLVVNMIRGKYNTPWRLKEGVTLIQQKVQHHGIKIKYCYSEGNEVADALAKHAATLTQQAIFLNETEMPAEARNAMSMDRRQIPNFRIRPKKHSGWIFDPP